MNVKSMQRAILIAILATAFPVASFAGYFGVGIGINVGFAPPPLPVYDQPPCPASGYIWTPGYWAYAGDDEDYYWVPGTWVMAPSPGLLWTPGYWGVVGAGYAWNEGYWGPQVGFYGGINYGFGYFGVGFDGGYWRGNDFFYNRSVNNISNINITNVYNRTVTNNFYDNHASFNGGNGVRATPTPSDLAAARQPHRGITAPQRTQAASARTLPSSLASINHGHPPIAATQRPGAFQGSGVVAANATARTAPPLGNRAQNSPTGEHSSAASHGGLPAPATARNYQSPHGNQAQRNFPPQNASPAPRNDHAYQPPHGTAPAPRNYQSYQPPHGATPAPRNYQSYQPPRSAAPAPRNYQAYQPPRSTYQQPNYSVQRDTHNQPRK